jgi:hypothetical protein
LKTHSYSIHGKAILLAADSGWTHQLNRVKKVLRNFPLVLTPKLMSLEMWSADEAFLYVEETLCVATDFSKTASHHLPQEHILCPECLTSFS